MNEFFCFVEIICTNFSINTTPLVLIYIERKKAVFWQKQLDPPWNETAVDMDRHLDYKIELSCSKTDNSVPGYWKRDMLKKLNPKQRQKRKKTILYSKTTVKQTILCEKKSLKVLKGQLLNSILADPSSWQNLKAIRTSATDQSDKQTDRQTDISFPISYQLMNELFPAEWFPMSMMEIFFLGGSSFSPSSAADSMSPLAGSVYSPWHSFRIRSLTVVVAASRADSEEEEEEEPGAPPRKRTRPDMAAEKGSKRKEELRTTTTYLKHWLTTYST